MNFGKDDYFKVPTPTADFFFRRHSMAQKMDARETVSVEEALQMEMIINQALIDLLFEKGIMTRQELMDKIEEIKKNLPAERVDN